jgi:hypothetical protein
MARAAVRLAILLSLLSVLRAHDEHEDEHRMYDLFWTVFWVASFGFLIYLICTYLAYDPPPAPRSRDDNVINVRIINPANG